MAEENCNPPQGDRSAHTTMDIVRLVMGTRLDEIIKECMLNEERGLGAQNCCCKQPSACSPCGRFGPVRCPSNLMCPPMGTRCANIQLPRCSASVPGCKMCNNIYKLPMQPHGKARCCGRP